MHQYGGTWVPRQQRVAVISLRSWCGHKGLLHWTSGFGRGDLPRAFPRSESLREGVGVSVYGRCGPRDSPEFVRLHRQHENSAASLRYDLRLTWWN